MEEESEEPETAVEDPLEEPEESESADLDSAAIDTFQPNGDGDGGTPEPTDGVPPPIEAELEDPGTPLENEKQQESSEEEDEEDDIQITIRDIKANVSFGGLPVKPRFSGAGNKQSQQKLDVDATAQVNGTNIFDFDISSADEKPWRKPGADITDYFNYGFTEDTWQTYCERQRKLRMEFGAAQANRIFFSSVTGLGLVNPGTISNDNSKYQTKTVVNLTKNLTPQLPPQHISVLGGPNVLANQLGQALGSPPAQQQQQPTIFRTNLAMAPNTPTSLLNQGGSREAVSASSSGGMPPTSENNTPVSGNDTPNSNQPQSLFGSDSRDAPKLSFPNMSMPPPAFPPTNLPPPGFPGMMSMPPTNLPPPGVMPPGMHPPPPGVQMPPGGFAFPPPNRPMGGPMSNPPPGFQFGERPPFHGGWPPHQNPHEMGGDRSPASYSDKSSDVEDRERDDRYDRHSREYRRDKEYRRRRTDRSPPAHERRGGAGSGGERRHRSEREHSASRSSAHRHSRGDRSRSRERHRERSDRDRERGGDKEGHSRPEEEDKDRRGSKKRRKEEGSEGDRERTGSSRKRAEGESSRGREESSGGEDRRSKRRGDKTESDRSRSGRTAAADETLPPGVDGSDSIRVKVDTG